ncbi:MAG: hypothetical protein DSY91_04980 [Deltaproteobacteria bacterium]|nr:MAG: hypothetical protein DSY91_04980 [Deltaproteobacteria bacterium]
MRELPGEEVLARLRREFPYSDTEIFMTFIRIIHLQHAVPILFDQYFSKMGLSKARFMVLVQLYMRGGKEGLSISEISSFYEVSSATMTGVVDTLEKEGYVTRLHSKMDRRRVILKLTKRGELFMRRFIPVHSSNLRNMMRAFSEEDLKSLMLLNERLVESIEAFLDSDSLKVPGKGYGN